MKKLLGLVVLVGLYVAAAYYTGVQGEKNIRQQFALAEVQNKAQGVVMTLNSYERGVFFSEINFSATYANSSLPIFPLTATSTTKVQHGPLLFLGGFGVGLFSSTSDLQVELADEEINAQIKKLFGDSIGEIVTHGHFNNTYTSTWKLPELKYSEDGHTLTLAASSLTAKGSYSGLDMTGSFNIGASEWLHADGSKMSSTPMTGNFDMTNISELVNISNMDMAVDAISITSSTAVNVAIEKLKIVQTQKLVGGKIDTFVSFTADKVKAPVEITDLRYDIALNQVDPAAVKKWTELAQAAQSSSSDPEQMMAIYTEQLPELAELLLQKGLQFKLAMGAKFMDGSSQIDLTADYKPLANGQKLSEITKPEDYLLLADADLMIKVSESIVSQTPLIMMVGEYMGTYVTREGDLYVVHGTLKDGKVMVGSTELPPEMLLAFLPAGASDELDDTNTEEPMLDDEGE